MNSAERLARLLGGRSRWIFAAALALLLFSLGPLGRVQFGTDIFELMPPDLPSVRAFREFSAHFAQGNDLIVVVQPRPPADSAATHAFLDALAAALQTLSGVRAVHPSADERDEDPSAWREALPYWTAWFNAHDWAEVRRRLQPDAIRERVHRLRAALEAAPSPVAAEQLLADPLKIFEMAPPRFKSAAVLGDRDADSLFRSADGSLHALYVEAAGNIRDSHFCIRLHNAVRAAVAALPARPDFDVRYTGSIVFASEIAAKMRRNMIATASSSMVMVSLVFWIGFRRIYPLFCIALTLALAVLTTLACGQILFGGLNLITVSFAAILVGLGVDYGIVVYERLCAETTASIAAQPLAQRTLAAIGPAVALGAATTATAFLTIALSASPAFRQFGFVVAIGIGLCAILMLTLFLCLQLRRLPKILSTPSSPSSDLRQARTRVVAAAAITALALGWLFVGSPKGVRLDANPASLEFRRSDAKETLILLHSKLGRPSQTLQTFVHGRDGWEAVARARLLEQRLHALASAGVISSFESAARFFPPSADLSAIERQRREIDFAAAAAAFRKALTEQGLAPDAFASTWEWFARQSRGTDGSEELRRALESLPSLRPWWSRFVSIGGDGWRLALYVHLPRPLSHTAEARRLEKALGGVPLASWDLLALESLPRLRSDFQRVSLVALAMVVAVLGAFYRRVSLVFLALLPLTLSVVWLLALMKLLNIPFTLANFFCLPIVLGAGIDYGIYVLNAWRRENTDAAAAVRRVRKAIVMAAATTSIGFGSLILANHAGLASFGLLTALGICFCAIHALLVLPAWLTWWGTRA